MINNKVYTVTQINTYVKKAFMYDPLLNDLWIKGEISNLKKHSSGHIYFTLKDDGGAISAVMFRSHASNLIFDPEEGMEIITKGYVSLYEKTGQYQFYAQLMEPDGQGALYKAFEQLKNKLESEGLFDPSNKKTIPRFPKKVGIITSGTGAAIQDIINVSSRRNKTIQLYLIPVLVQGVDASKSIQEAIRQFNENYDVDVLIVGRGGGSIEDLWAFNEEIVARAIFESKIPIISAVGHETDYTIADFVADLRAPTPSAAAELAIPSLLELHDLLGNYQTRLRTSLDGILMKKRERLITLSNHPAFRAPQQKIDQNKQYLDHLLKRLQMATHYSVEQKKQLLKSSHEKLELLSPINNLNRGFSIVMDEVGNPISSANQIEEGQVIAIQLKDGHVRASVIKKEME